MSDENLTQVKIADITLDAGTQPRAGLHEPTVERYRESYQDGDTLPPVILFYDGQKRYPGDGFHRIEAAARAGLTEISADVRQGTLRDAILYSVGANAAHGLPRSADDVRRAIERLLRDPEWGQWSNREIARRVHTSHTTVGRVRNELIEAGEIEPVTERTYERDGEVKTMNVESIGTKRLHLHRRFPGHRLVACGPDEDGEYIGRHKVYSGGMWKVRSRKLAADRAVLVDWFEINERTLEAEASSPGTGTLFQLEPDEMKPPLAGLSWHDDLLQASREAYRLHPDILACLGKTGIYNIALGRDAIRLTKALHVRGKFVPCAEDAKADWLWVIDAAQVEELVNDGHSLARLELDDQAVNDLARAVMAGADMPWEVARREEAAAYARERKEKAPATLHIFDEATSGGPEEADWLHLYEAIGQQRVTVHGPNTYVDGYGYKAMHQKAVGQYWQTVERELFAEEARADAETWFEEKVEALRAADVSPAEPQMTAPAAVENATRAVASKLGAGLPAPKPSSGGLPDWVADETPAQPDIQPHTDAVTLIGLVKQLEAVEQRIALMAEQAKDPIEKAVYGLIPEQLGFWSLHALVATLDGLNRPSVWDDVRNRLKDVDLDDEREVRRALRPVFQKLHTQLRQVS